MLLPPLASLGVEVVGVQSLGPLQARHSLTDLLDLLQVHGVAWGVESEEQGALEQAALKEISKGKEQVEEQLCTCNVRQVGELHVEGAELREDAEWGH